MTEKESPKTYWFLPSISDVIFVIVLAIILSGKGSLLGDADTGYHIRAGEYIIGNLKVPDHDIFSHISPPVKCTRHVNHPLACKTAYLFSPFHACLVHGP